MSEKVKALVARILKECEQEGLTLNEATSIPSALRQELNERVTKIYGCVDVNGFRIAKGTSDKASDTH